MGQIDFRLRALAPWVRVVVYLGVLLLMGTPFIAVPSVVVAHDEGSGPPFQFTPVEFDLLPVTWTKFLGGQVNWK